MLRNTGDTEALIVEYGFLDSSLDDVQQLKNNWQQYADAVVRAVADYLNLDNITDNEFYTVKIGDTLWSIAKKNNISVNELKSINNLSSNLLSIGQKIIIPQNNDIYIVKSGDTLYSIAEKNNTSVSNIMRTNNLSSNLLVIGQKLQIPKTKITSDNIYIVKNGDTLYSIARNNNITVDELKAVNNLVNNNLILGQVLKLPSKIYIVENGDTLYSIALKNNTTVDNLKQLNNLSNNNISIGQKLKI